MNKLLTGFFAPMIGMLFILLLHFNTRVDTMLNQWNDQDKNAMHHIDQQALREAVDYHKVEPAFARRPLSTFLFEKTASMTHLPIGTSFILVNFLLLVCCGIAIYLYSLQVSFTVAEAVCSQLIFYSGFTILCAFFNTNYTYDEPLTYLCFIVSLIAFFRNKTFLFFLFFLLSCLCRESSYLFVPVFLYLSFYKKDNPARYKHTILFAAAFMGVIVLHAYFLQWVYPSFFTSQSQQELTSRMDLVDFNFQDKRFGRETIVSFFIVNAIPLYLLLQSWNHIKKNKVEKKHLSSFLFLLSCNTVIVLYSTIARESRLFALPLLLIYPLLGRYFLLEIKKIRTSKLTKCSVAQWCLIAVNLSILYLAHGYIFTVYETTIHPKQFNYNGEYLFAIVLVIVGLNTMSLLTEQQPTNVDQDIYR